MPVYHIQFVFKNVIINKILLPWDFLSKELFITGDTKEEAISLDKVNNTKLMCGGAGI